MEPISLLLDSLLELADRILNLEKTKFQNKQILFNEVVKPLFEEMEPVAKNYIQIFRNAKKMVSNTSPRKLQEVILTIRDDRELMTLGRIKIREMASQIEVSIKDEKVVDFAHGVNSFFYNAIQYNSKRITTSIFVIKNIEQAGATHKDKNVIIDYLDSTIENLETIWGFIVRSYEKLKIYSTTPPILVHKREIKKGVS